MPIDYDQLAATYATTRSAHPVVMARLHDAVVAAQQAGAGRLLEIGCGTGNYVGALQDATGAAAWGIDPSAEMLAVARNRWPFALFFIGIMGAAAGIAFAREGIGLEAVIWIAGVVVISDIMGYFAGRAFGGPKFWPAISPKKTWSGTVAGWIGALVFTIILQMIVGRLDLVQVLLAPVIALAGQMGDIAESWLKRRVGVKDSSDLIPGHGGVMDRFDAMAGAFLAMMLISLAIAGYLLIFDFPVSGG